MTTTAAGPRATAVLKVRAVSSYRHTRAYQRYISRDHALTLYGGWDAVPRHGRDEQAAAMEQHRLQLMRNTRGRTTGLHVIWTCPDDLTEAEAVAAFASWGRSVWSAYDVMYVVHVGHGATVRDERHTGGRNGHVHAILNPVRTTDNRRMRYDGRVDWRPLAESTEKFWARRGYDLARRGSHDRARSQAEAHILLRGRDTRRRELARTVNATATVSKGAADLRRRLAVQGLTVEARAGYVYVLTPWANRTGRRLRYSSRRLALSDRALELLTPEHVRPERADIRALLGAMRCPAQHVEPLTAAIASGDGGRVRTAFAAAAKEWAAVRSMAATISRDASPAARAAVELAAAAAREASARAEFAAREAAMERAVDRALWRDTAELERERRRGRMI